MLLLSPKDNLGFARGVNLALNDPAALDSDAFLLINNDAVATTGMVASLAAALTDTGGAMVAPTVVNEAGELQPVLWYQRFTGMQTTRRWPGSFPYPSGSCLLVSRAMLKDGRIFDEDFFMYGEDTLLGWRLVRAGKTPLLLDNAVVRHDGTGSSRRGEMFYEYHMARAHILLATKTWRYSFLEIPFMLISKASVLCIRASFRSLRFRSFVPLKAFFMAWRALNVRVP
jgi:GT2 family glycosyltransferase